MTVRLDVSGVPPQGGYVAKQCPVRPQWDVLRPVEPLPVSAPMQRRFDLGSAFEAEVLADLVALHPGVAVVDGDEDRTAREDATIAAMASGAALIVGGRLPTDEAGRRVGEPDLLVAARDGGYHPVDVKHHQSLADPMPGREHLDALTSDLASPAWPEAIRRADKLARKTKADLLQLAHYRRLLEASGQQAAENRAGIIGTERAITWYDLDEAIWTTPSVSEGRKRRSTMEIYDFEFAFRLDIIATARRHAEDPSVELLVVPVRIGECAECPWWDHCHTLLVDAADISLLPKLGWNAWKRHNDRGVHTLADLAGLDHRSAHLCDRGVDLARLFDALTDRPDDTLVADLIGKQRRAQIDNLANAGVETVGDARSLDRRVGPYSGVNVGGLARSVDLARAYLADAPVFLRRGVERLDVRRFDVEVDLDLENSEDGVYLWGVLVTDRADTNVAETGYRPFVDWQRIDPKIEVALAEQMWRWLTGLRESCREGGHTIGIYCFNEKAEAGSLRRLVASELVTLPGFADSVEEVLGSEEWIDLLEVADHHLITGGSKGLKKLAPLAGFAWEDEDAGGEQSKCWHDLAVDGHDPDVRESNRHRILTYNRNDVEATLALRNWMQSEGDHLPRIEDLDAVYGW